MASGPGNAPAYIERSADVAKAVRDIVTGKTFDNGLLCSSENSVVVDEPIADAVRAEFRTQGGYFLSPPKPTRWPRAGDAAAAAQSRARRQARDRCRRHRPASPCRPATRVLIAPLEGVGRDYPLSIEKLCPVLSFYVVKDWREGCERCKQILRYGGMGHTMSIHSQNDDIILQFGLHKPAYRIVVNTPTTHGSIGLTTGLDPAMTLGCGGFGGNITSDNISPLHLLNIKRLAYETHAGPDRRRPRLRAGRRAGSDAGACGRASRRETCGRGSTRFCTLAVGLDRRRPLLGFGSERSQPLSRRRRPKASDVPPARPSRPSRSSAKTMSGRRCRRDDASRRRADDHHPGCARAGRRRTASVEVATASNRG